MFQAFDDNDDDDDCDVVQANGEAGKKQLPAALKARLLARGIIKVCIFICQDSAALSCPAQLLHITMHRAFPCWPTPSACCALCVLMN